MTQKTASAWWIASTYWATTALWQIVAGFLTIFLLADLFPLILSAPFSYLWGFLILVFETWQASTFVKGRYLNTNAPSVFWRVLGINALLSVVFLFLGDISFGSSDWLIAATLSIAWFAVYAGLTYWFLRR